MVMPGWWGTTNTGQDPWEASVSSGCDGLLNLLTSTEVEEPQPAPGGGGGASACTWRRWRSFSLHLEEVEEEVEEVQPAPKGLAGSSFEDSTSCRCVQTVLSLGCTLKCLLFAPGPPSGPGSSHGVDGPALCATPLGFGSVCCVQTLKPVTAPISLNFLTRMCNSNGFPAPPKRIEEV
ncbi:unnamed protein product [Gadus morhua 'NCC']